MKDRTCIKFGSWDYIKRHIFLINWCIESLTIVYTYIYEPKEKGRDQKRSRLPVAKSTFRDRLDEQSRKKSVKKQKKKNGLSVFFLVSLQLEIIKKSENHTFQFEIFIVSRSFFYHNKNKKKSLFLQKCIEHIRLFLQKSKICSYVHAKTIKK